MARKNSDDKITVSNDDDLERVTLDALLSPAPASDELTKPLLAIDRSSEPVDKARNKRACQDPALNDDRRWEVTGPTSGVMWPLTCSLLLSSHTNCRVMMISRVKRQVRPTTCHPPHKMVRAYNKKFTWTSTRSWQESNMSGVPWVFGRMERRSYPIIIIIPLSGTEPTSLHLGAGFESRSGHHDLKKGTCALSSHVLVHGWVRGSGPRAALPLTCHRCGIHYESSFAAHGSE